MSDITVEAVYPHPPARVWRALTDPDELESWLMENDFQPRVGHRFQFRDEPRPGWRGIGGLVSRLILSRGWNRKLRREGLSTTLAEKATDA